MHNFTARVLILFSSIVFSIPTLAAPRILIIGDSLTEGLGVAASSAYPALLEKKLRKGGCTACEVVNAGISGATTASGVKTLRFHMNHKKPDWLIYALGANDALRGLSVEQTTKNIDEALSLAAKNNIKTVLAGMKAPPNYGAAFTQQFANIFPTLAKKNQVTLLPFLLEGVAGEPPLNQPDGIHPNEKGHEIIAETIYLKLKPLL